MRSLAPFFVPMLLIALAMAIVGVVVRMVWRILAHRRTMMPVQPTTSRCRCGYELSNLDRIRCPECGKVFGFDATPEQLGLSDEEIRRATEARLRRQISNEAAANVT